MSRSATVLQFPVPKPKPDADPLGLDRPDPKLFRLDDYRGKRPKPPPPPLTENEIHAARWTAELRGTEAKPGKWRNIGTFIQLLLKEHLDMERFTQSEAKTLLGALMIVLENGFVDDDLIPWDFRDPSTAEVEEIRAERESTNESEFVYTVAGAANEPGSPMAVYTQYFKSAVVLKHLCPVTMDIKYLESHALWKYHYQPVLIAVFRVMFVQVAERYAEIRGPIECGE